MIFLLLEIFLIGFCKNDCPLGYYGENCDIYVPGTAFIVGKFDNMDCMVGFRHLDGFIIDYEVRKSYLPLDVTKCNELLTDEAKIAIFNNTNAEAECTWLSENEYDESFIGVQVRGVIGAETTRKFVEDKDFPDPFPVKIINTEHLTVNIQLDWFDRSNIIEHLCAPTKEPSIYIVLLILTICGISVLFSFLVYCICILKPECVSAYNQICDIENETNKQSFKTPRRIQSSSSNDYETSSSDEEGGITTDDDERENQILQPVQNNRHDDLGIYDNFDEEIDNERSDAFSLGEDNELNDLIEQSDDDDNEFSS